ncbi:AAA family ATPase [Pseudomonas aeruginosa]
MSEYWRTPRRVAAGRCAPPGYVGYDEGGQLTERVRRQPYSVILLDEIEKAHADVNNILLQVFDDGRLTDGKGAVVDFTNTIIIATSNLGSGLIMKNAQAGEVRPAAGEAQARTDDYPARAFPPGIPQPPRRGDRLRIVEQGADRGHRAPATGAGEARRARPGHLPALDDSLVGHLAEEAYQPEFGARELKRQIRQQLETRLATAILKGEVKEGGTITFFYDAKDGVGYLRAPRRNRRHARNPAPARRPRAARRRRGSRRREGAAAKGKADKPKAK